MQYRNGRQRRYSKNNEVWRCNIEMVDNVAIQRTMKFDVSIKKWSTTSLFKEQCALTLQYINGRHRRYLKNNEVWRFNKKMVDNVAILDMKFDIAI